MSCSIDGRSIALPPRFVALAKSPLAWPIVFKIRQKIPRLEPKKKGTRAFQQKP
jgi:hypothetical protein